MRLLALDTATENCSVALLIEQELIGQELELGRSHAEHILTMIDELLAQAGTHLSALDAIAFGRGPGGFTGVRLAASVTQGLAFGAGLPVVPISDLLAVAQRALGEWGDGAAARVIVCNDARMHEVYWGCFERPAGTPLAVPLGQERVGRPETVTVPGAWGGEKPILAAGRGFSAYPALRSRLPEPHGVYDQLLPRAHEIARLALLRLQAGEAVDAEHAIPVYVRDDVAQPAER
jgi:tRNA threonylcarbamoyladenosine biosynthesis protein TsaB